MEETNPNTPKTTPENEAQEKSYLQNLEEDFKESFEDEPFTVVPELGMAFSIGRSDN